MDEMQLRTVAVALRSTVHVLLPADQAARMQDALAEALLRPPGRAGDALRKLLLDPAVPAVRSWVLAHLHHDSAEGRWQPLDDTRLVAPISGNIAMRKVDPGQTVAAGVPVFTIVELNPVKVRVGVPEA